MRRIVLFVALAALFCAPGYAGETTPNLGLHKYDLHERILPLLNDDMDTLDDHVGANDQTRSEVNDARGSKSSLDARMDESLNEDGTIKSSAMVGSPWIQEDDTVTYIATHQFSVPGDETATYTMSRRIKAVLVGSTVYSGVQSATYNSGPDTTTVTLDDSVLTDPINELYYGVVVSGSGGNLPKIKNEDLSPYAAIDNSKLQCHATIPTYGEKLAMAGTHGSPGPSNKFVTDTDPRVPTEDETDALAGTSGTPPSSGNKFVDNSDTRIPTQDENDALAGEGTPSGSNKFTTKSYSDSKYSREFECIVDASGNGDYADPISAIGAGKKSIFIRAGTYNLGSSLSVPSDTRIIGENLATTILDFGGNSYSLVIDGSPVYATGTIAINNGSTTVTGTGTTWSGTAEAGDYILLRNAYFEIQSVDSNTQITIVETFRGESITVDNCYIMDPVQNVTIESITVRNSQSSCISMSHFRGVFIGDVKVSKTSLYDGLDADIGELLHLESITATECPAGFLIGQGSGRTVSVTLRNLQAIGNGLSGGFEINARASTVSGCVAVHNNGDGFSVDGTTVVLNGCISEMNNGDGLRIESGANRPCVLGGSFTNNTGYGIRIESGATNSLVVGNACVSNGGGAILDNGTSTIKEHNQN